MKKIDGKAVYIVEKHQHSIVPWAIFRRKLENPPIMLTLDQHTDCLPSFSSYAANKIDKSPYIKWNDEAENIVERAIKEINFNDLDTVELVASRLKDDGQIDAAIRSDILRAAFIISFEDSDDKPLSIEMKEHYHKFDVLERLKWTKEPIKPERPFKYPISENGIYAIGCEYYDDDNMLDVFNKAIESENLVNRFQTIFEINDSVKLFTDFFQDNYILDIDLDYFHTRKSISPDDPSFFYSLIRHAGIISIAKEPGYIDGPQYETGIDSEFLLARLLDHIQNALGSK